MFIATKDTKVIAIHEVEWQCRRNAKGLSKPEYWKWLESITTEGVSDYSGEDYEIVEIYSRSYESTDDEGNSITIQVDPLSYESTDENGITRTITFHESGHITIPYVGEKISYHLKWDASKKEVVKDDTAKAAYDLAEEWKRIRTERTRLLAETDWVVIKARENGGQVPTAWKTYRVALRDLPAEQSDKTKYSEITWPTQPS